MEQFRLSWDAAAYAAACPELPMLRRDLLQQRRWGRLVRLCVIVGVVVVVAQAVTDNCSPAQPSTLKGCTGDV